MELLDYLEKKISSVHKNYVICALQGDKKTFLLCDKCNPLLCSNVIMKCDNNKND